MHILNDIWQLDTFKNYFWTSWHISYITSFTESIRQHYFKKGCNLENQSITLIWWVVQFQDKYQQNFTIFNRHLQTGRLQEVNHRFKYKMKILVVSCFMCYTLEAFTKRCVGSLRTFNLSTNHQDGNLSFLSRTEYAQQLIPISDTTVHKTKSYVALNVVRVFVP